MQEVKEQITPEHKELFIKIYRRLTAIDAEEYRHFADYGAIMPNLWEALQDISKYGLSPAKDEQANVGDWVEFKGFEGVLEPEIDGIHRIWNGDKQIDVLVSELPQVKKKSQEPSSTVASDEVIKEAEKMFPVHPNESDPITRHIQRAKQHGYIAALTAQQKNGKI